MRRTEALARDYAQRHGVPRWYDSADDLINDTEVDAVYIATPPSPHKEYTLLGAQAGKPVYVEKPMALNFAECQTMLQTCRTVGVPLFVAYYRRALARFLKIGVGRCPSMGESAARTSWVMDQMLKDARQKQ